MQTVDEKEIPLAWQIRKLENDERPKDRMGECESSAQQREPADVQETFEVEPR
jgi:hypothetical protein